MQNTKYPCDPLDREMLHFILEGQLTKDAVLFFQQKLQKTLSLDLKELGYGSNQKRDFHAGTPAHFFIQVLFYLCSSELRKTRRACSCNWVLQKTEEKVTEASPPALLVALESSRQDFIWTKILHFLLARMGCVPPDAFFTLQFDHIS